MTLTQLECFLALAERLNFTQTANDLFMAQTTLSRNIFKLEQEVGVQLFIRSSHAVSLTKAGQAFFQECAESVKKVQQAVDAARLAEQDIQGEITVGILQNHFDAQMVYIYRKMQDRHPWIRLSFREQSAVQLETSFAAGELDVIIHFSSLNHDPEQERIPLCQNRSCVVVSSDSLWANRESIQTKELKNEPFVAISPLISRLEHDFLWQMASRAGFQPKVVAEARHVPALLMMVACGIGHTFMMDNVAAFVGDLVTFVPLEDGIRLTRFLIWQKQNQNPSLPFLVETVKELYA